MTYQKRTIQVANGIAEEGDRVCNFGFKFTGHIRNINDDDTVDFALTKGGQQRSADPENLMLIFHPDDALEAIEEEMKEINDAFDMSEDEQRKKFLDHLFRAKERIQQKRKGQ